MTRSLIRLQDGVLVEIEERVGRRQQTAHVSALDAVSGSLSDVENVLKSVCRPIAAAWRELNKEMSITETEIEVGLSFEGEGNIFLVKGTMGANLIVKMTLEPPE